MSDVGKEVQTAFWHCSRDFEVVSSRGVVPLGNARIAQVDFSFVDELPVIPEALLDVGLIKHLRESGDLQDVKVDDIIWILEKSKKTRTPSQLVSQL